MSQKKARSKSAPAKQTTSSWSPQWLILFLLSAITLAAYWNSFLVPLVFDDLMTIQRNTAVRFGEFSGNLLYARSILYLTFTLNYLWTGQDVWSYHLVNFVLHLLNGLLVFALGQRVFRVLGFSTDRCQQYAGLAAAFFLLHPVQTESVTYISSRSELLSTLFYLAGFLIYVFWPQQRIGFLCSLAVGVPYFFGLGSKETVITLPATIFLYDFLFLSKAQFRPILGRWRFYLTYALGAAAATYFILTIALRGSVGQGLAGHLSSWHYFLTQLRVITHYVRLIFIPVGQNLDYDFRPSASPFEPAVLGSFIFLSALVVLGWMLRRRAPVFAFSIFWFFITLAPTSSIVPILDVVFEHRLYLPLIGVCLSFPLLVEQGYAAGRRRWALRGTALRYALSLLIALAVGTVLRNSTWGDEVRLFADVAAKSPGKSRAQNGLAWAHYKRADYDKAIDVLQGAMERMPDKTTDFADMLGQLYLKTGRFDAAVKLFERIVPTLKGAAQAQTYNNMGVAYLYMWNDIQARRAQFSDQEYAARTESVLKPAADAFLNAVKIDHRQPGYLDSHINVMSYLGKGDETALAASERLQHKQSFDDLYTVGKVAFNKADYAKADEYFEQAGKIRNDVKILFFNHGYALTQLKQDDRAIQKYIEAIRLEPIFIEAHHNLGQLYMHRNEYAKAEEAFAEVLRQDPRHVSSNLYLAAIYISRGNKLLARNHLHTVLEASPGNEQATAMLTQLGG